MLAGIPVAFADETKHFKLIGTTGTGKSTAIRELLETALARGDRAVIADPDGGYLNTFYDAGRGDVILNPFAPGSAKWSLLGEITNDYDVEQLARSLIPDSGDPDRVWSDYARTFFTAVVQQVVLRDIKEDSEVDRLIDQASVKELRELLANTSASPLLAEGNERMFGCVRSITTSALRSLKYVTRQQGTPFSVRTWVSKGAARHAGGSGGVLFLPYKAGEIAALRSLISAWMRLAIFEAMNREEGDQRLWFVIDELDALGEIDGLKDALARVRKFGGRTVLSLQSIAQVSSSYGKGVANTIVENCGNTFIFRCSASEHGGTSEFASKLIGQREVTHTMRSRTRRPGEWRASTTLSEQVKIEPAVMSSEIERLPDLEGFLKFASIPDWRRVTLIPPRGFAGGENKQRVAAVAAASPESVAPGGAASSEPIVTPSVPQTGDSAFTTPPSGGAHSDGLPRPRNFKKATRTPMRKPRAKRSDPADAQVGTLRNDVQGAP
jgi:type IV secretory pathway TraG/TraD family ATPase VirD4